LSLSNEKTKNSLSGERRGSIVKSIDKLASSIAADEVNAVAAAFSSSMNPMFMVMQKNAAGNFSRLSCREMLNR